MRMRRIAWVLTFAGFALGVVWASGAAAPGTADPAEPAVAATIADDEAVAQPVTAPKLVPRRPGRIREVPCPATRECFAQFCLDPDSGATQLCHGEPPCQSVDAGLVSCGLPNGASFACEEGQTVHAITCPCKCLGQTCDPVGQVRLSCQ